MEKEAKEAAFVNTIANCWIEKKLPYSKFTDEQQQEFKTAIIEKLLNERPQMISNGNTFFKGLPYTPIFPWMYWMYINWETFKITTRQGTTNPLEENST